MQEIILEQGFQDLTGQALKKVIELVTNVEKELVDYDLKMLRAVVQSHIAKSGIERFIIQ